MTPATGPLSTCVERALTALSENLYVSAIRAGMVAGGAADDYQGLFLMIQITRSPGRRMQALAELTAI